MQVNKSKNASRSQIQEITAEIGKYIDTDMETFTLLITKGTFMNWGGGKELTDNPNPNRTQNNWIRGLEKINLTHNNNYYSFKELIKSLILPSIL